MTDNLYPLAVLRAAVEGVDLGTYFGSTAALDEWVAITRDLGWLNDDNRPADAGRAVYAARNLARLPNGRAAFWPLSREWVEEPTL